jgi:hypothetical protein
LRGLAVCVALTLGLTGLRADTPNGHRINRAIELLAAGQPIYYTGSLPPQMQAARARVLAATKTSKIFCLNSVTADNVVDMIKEGVMIGAANERAAETGRKYSKRTLPS